MSASAWSPNSRTVTQANANGLVKQETKIATANQRVFSLDTFAYAVGTGSVEVYLNGKILTRNRDFAELNETEVILMNPTVEDDEVTIVGFVGITGTATVDAILRSDLASDSGAGLVGFKYSSAGSISRNLSEYLRDGYVSVTSFGAVGDGVTDDSVAIQAAIDACVGPTTNKVVFLPSCPVRYRITTPLIFYSHTTIIGETESVVIRQTNLSAPAFKSYNYDALTGTNNLGGVTKAQLLNFTCEGVVSSSLPTGTTTQHGISLYGFGNTFRDLHIRGFGGIGLNTEWATPGSAPSTGYDDGFVESRYQCLKVYLNGLSGIKCNGSHDGQWFGVISYSNNHLDVSANKPNVWIATKGNPQYIDQLHAWGNSSGVGLLLEGSASITNPAIEGATIAQVKITTGEIVIKGGLIFAAGSSASIGVQFVGGPTVCVGYDIDTTIEGCNGGSFDFGTGIDSYKINVRVFQTAGSITLGTQPTSAVGGSFGMFVGGGANNRATVRKDYQYVVTNLAIADTNGIGLLFADHGGEGVISVPQRKTEPAGTVFPASGFFGYGRVNGFRVHQSSSNTIGTLMGEPVAAITPVDNLDVSFYQLNTLAAAGAPVTINNLVGGLNGFPVAILLPSAGSTITLSVAGNMRTKTGAAISTGAAKQLIVFYKARDGLYYQS